MGIFFRYRVVLSKMIQINISSRESQEIRRLSWRVHCWMSHLSLLYFTLCYIVFSEPYSGYIWKKEIFNWYESIALIIANEFIFYFLTCTITLWIRKRPPNWFCNTCISQKQIAYNIKKKAWRISFKCSCDN